MVASVLHYDGRARYKSIFTFEDQSITVLVILTQPNLSHWVVVEKVGRNMLPWVPGGKSKYKQLNMQIKPNSTSLSVSEMVNMGI